ncbi:tripartite motif-containing protein 75-like [Thomomys bottae]
MDVQAILAKFQMECKCSICLEELRDPVTIDCGHNFCRSCIRQTWTQMEMLSCPVCRHPCMAGYFWSNHQLEKMIEISQQLLLSQSEEKTLEETHSCEKHQQDLLHFCEEDLELLCDQCIQHPDHKGHLVRPVPVAATDHRLKFQSCIASLNSQVSHGQKELVAQYKERVFLGNNLEEKRQKLTFEFYCSKTVVAKKQEAFLSKLQKEQQMVREQVDRITMDLESYRDCVEDLLIEMEKKSKMAEVKLLTHMKKMVHKYESLKPPDFPSVRFKKESCTIPLPFTALQKIRKKFQVEFTLDPQTAHPNVYVSTDKRSVKFVQRVPSLHLCPMQVMDYPTILGDARFTSGRHYWEVQVGDKDAWTVGVCKDYLCQDRKWPTSGLNKCWAIQLFNYKYVARNAVLVNLALTEQPKRVGIYLDYELGEVSFYNSSDNTHIHTFMDEFSEALKPFFGIGFDLKPLTLCSEKD